MDKFPMSLDVRDADYRTAVEELIFSVNTLEASGLEFDDIPADVLSVYYADFVLLELVEAGVGEFRDNQLPMNPLTERDVLAALDRIGAPGHRKFFADVILGARERIPGLRISASKADRMLADIGQTENLEELTGALLKNTDQIEWIEDGAVDSRLAELAMEQIVRNIGDKED